MCLCCNKLRRVVPFLQTSSSHQRLLSAALSLVARQGFAQTSTAQVARQAGTSESQLIKHFGSKDGLLEALFDSLWNDLNHEIEGLTTSRSDPVNQLKAIVALVMTRLADNAEIRRLMLFEGRRIRTRGTAVSAGFVRFVSHIDAQLSDIKKAGRLRVPLPAAAIRSCLIGAGEGLLRDRQLAEETNYPADYSREDVERTMETLFAAFFADRKRSLQKSASSRAASRRPQRRGR